MVDSNDVQTLESRPPTLADLVRLCHALNTAGAKYIIVGGMAIIHHGFVRATQDIDLLVDTSPENFAKLRAGMSVLPDNAMREVSATDLDQYVVVRVADEIVVDLMKSACGIDFDAARKDIEQAEIDGVCIPFANVDLLLRLKQTVREKDILDRQFLQQVIGREQGARSVSPKPRGVLPRLRAALGRLVPTARR